MQNLNPGRDVRATMEALRALGARIERRGLRHRRDGCRLARIVSADRLHELRIDGTHAAGRMHRSKRSGRDSTATPRLRRRPMEPVAAAVARVWRHASRRPTGACPLAFHGTPPGRNAAFHSACAVRSGEIGPAVRRGSSPGVASESTGDRGSRDHTERLLRYLGADIQWDGRKVAFAPRPLRSRPDLAVVGRLLVGGLFYHRRHDDAGQRVVDARRRRQPDPRRAAGRAPTDGCAHRAARTAANSLGRARCRHRGQSRAAARDAIGTDLALRAIDEIPLLAVAAAFAQGETRDRRRRDLRTKESDRVAAIERLLAAAGIATATLRRANGLRWTPSAATESIETQGDHRIAMAAAILAAAAGPIAIDSGASIGVSFPGFLRRWKACAVGASAAQDRERRIAARTPQGRIASRNRKSLTPVRIAGSEAPTRASASGRHRHLRPRRSRARDNRTESKLHSSCSARVRNAGLQLAVGADDRRRHRRRANDRGTGAEGRDQPEHDGCLGRRLASLCVARRGAAE